MSTQHNEDIVVVGGGLAGLAAATYLARSGRAVTLFEKSSHVGGRAITTTKGGFHLNLGPHALYRAGAGIRILRELGVTSSGGTPRTSGYAVRGGALHRLPSGPVSLLTTGLFGPRSRLEAARLLAGIGKVDARSLESMTVRQWLQGVARQDEVRQTLEALFRLSSYANDPDRQSAGASIAQLQRALANVIYLDGGWQTLVDGLYGAAQRAGVTIVSRTRVDRIEHDAGGVRAVRLADGSRHAAAAVIVAASPADACALVEGHDGTILRRWAATAVPVMVACLDVALDHLPRPHARLALGIDRPLYLSVHSAVARLAPGNGALIHVATYLGPAEETAERAGEREMEELLDLVQPGWRGAVVERRFLPRMVVSNALVTAGQGGTGGRPGPGVPGIDGLYVAGDWVGPEGMLCDASLASAKRAAELIMVDRGLHPRCHGAAPLAGVGDHPSPSAGAEAQQQQVDETLAGAGAEAQQQQVDETLAGVGAEAQQQQVDETLAGVGGGTHLPGRRGAGVDVGTGVRG